jgi:hypothetical protein
MLPESLFRKVSIATMFNTVKIRKKAAATKPRRAPDEMFVNILKLDEEMRTFMNHETMKAPTP